MSEPHRRRALENIKAIRSADVWKGDRLAATLTRTDAGVEFAYTADYLARPGPAVATTLPLTDATTLTPAGAVPAFFAGLLPEGRRLSSLRRAVKTSADDDLTLLIAVGADPVGDVRVFPAGQEPHEVRPLVEVQRGWSEVSFREVLADAGVRDPIALAGVQDKASAGMISLPLHQAGRSFILKIDPPEYRHMVLNENYFLTLARRAGFPVVNAHVVFDREERPGLLVERFDRVWDERTGSVRALPVEDASQLLGLYPADKYQVSSERVAQAIAAVCAARPLALREVFRQVVFAWLTGNGDLHAKNLSVMGSASGEWRVAPAYDIPSTAPYGDRTLALSVGGRRNGLSRRSLLSFAAAIGLPERAATQTLDSVLRATAPVLDEWSASGTSPFGSQQARQTLRVLRHRRHTAVGQRSDRTTSQRPPRCVRPTSPHTWLGRPG